MPRLFILLFVFALPASVSANSLEQLQKQLQLQQYDRAATTGLALLRQSPDDLQTRFLTALAFQKNNQPEQARRYYEQIIQQYPQLPEPRNNLAMVYVKLGEHDRAIDLLIESLNTHPAYATAWQNLSNLYKGLASEAYRKALSEEHNTSNVLDSIQLVALDKVNPIPLSTPSAEKTQLAAVSVPAAAEQPARTNEKPDQPATLSQPEVPAISPVTTAKAEPDLEQRLRQILQDWAQAWDNKAFDAYVNAYADDYQGNQASHAQWVEHRRSRILRSDPITVKISNIQIRSYDASRAIIDFTQAYKSPTYQDRVVKRVNLRKMNNAWKITSERTLKVL